MFDLNVGNLPITCEEGSVSEPLVLWSPVPDGFTDLQSRFIDAFVQLGGKGERAALEAGYSAGSASNIAVRNLSSPKIVEEIGRRLKNQGSVALAIAIGGLLRIIEHSKDDKAVVQAAVAICDRFGMSVPRGPAVAVQINNGTSSDVAQALLAEVAAARAERLAREERERNMSAIEGTMADTKHALIEHQKPSPQPAFKPPPRPAGIVPGGGGIFD